MNVHQCTLINNINYSMRMGRVQARFLKSEAESDMRKGICELTNDQARYIQISCEYGDRPCTSKQIETSDT